LKKDFPEVEDFCRLYNYELLLSNEARNTRFSETKSYVADAAALTLLHLPLIKGNPATALNGVNKIVISEETARKYFGSEDPMGKVLTNRNGGTLSSLEVTGVFSTYPENSHLVLDILISYPTLHQTFGAGNASYDPTELTWTWNDYYTYIELKKGTDPAAFQQKMRPFIDRHYNSLPENKAHNDFNTLQLYALPDIHLYSHYGEEAEANGALRTDLIRQFLVESLLLNGLALLLALVVAWIASPLFNQLTGRTLHNSISLPATYCEIFAALFLAGTFLSGIYPAFVLSRYHPVSVLKGLSAPSPPPPRRPYSFL
jgi:putative ABC transport system permease protein